MCGTKADNDWWHMSCPTSIKPNKSMIGGKFGISTQCKTQCILYLGNDSTMHKAPAAKTQAAEN